MCLFGKGRKERTDSAKKGSPNSRQVVRKEKEEKSGRRGAGYKTSTLVLSVPAEGGP